MSAERQLAEMKTKLERIERMLARLVDSDRDQRTKKQESKFVKVGMVQQLTGWNKEDMRRAREQQLIVYKKTGEGIRYDINSLDPRFLINQALNQTA